MTKYYTLSTSDEFWMPINAASLHAAKIAATKKYKQEGGKVSIAVLEANSIGDQYFVVAFKYGSGKWQPE